MIYDSKHKELVTKLDLLVANINAFIDWVHDQPSFEFQKQYFSSNQTTGILVKFVEDEYPEDRREHPIFIEFMLYPDITSSFINIYFCSKFGDVQDYSTEDTTTPFKFKGVFISYITTLRDLNLVKTPNQTEFDKLLNTNLKEYMLLIEKFISIFGVI